MSIPVPRLDDRDYADLVEELRSRIPAMTPEWTDVGPADPGRTLLELMAFLGESVLYRFNQLPEAAWAQVLRLLDVPLRPAVPATGLVTLALGSPATAADWPRVEASTIVRAGAAEFSTQDDVTVLPLRAEAMVKRRSDGPADADLQAEADAALDALGAGSAQPAFYETVGLPRDPAQARTHPLVIADAVDGALWIALRADTPDRVATLLDPQRSDGLPGQTVSIGVWADAPESSMVSAEPCPGWDPILNSGGQVSWVVSSVLGSDEAPVFVPVEVVVDLTGGLRHSGVVRLRLPAKRPDLGVPVPPAEAGGSGEFPPSVDDPGTVVCWLRALPLAGAAAIPPLTWVDVNATRVVQASRAEAEYLGTGTGNPDQLYPFAHRQLQPDLRDVVLDVEESDGDWVTWTRVSNLAEGGRNDRHWALDAEAGSARFGDTVRARVPQPGQRIRVRPYLYGGGAEGNLPAGALSTLDVTGPQLTVRNPLPTAGGVAAEGLGEGLDKVPGEFRRRDRAVTSSDFNELAEATPGAEVIRAECLPRFDPHTKATEAAGVVTVVVWPRDDPDHPDAPLPSRGLVGRVCRHLDERRLVTTELYVVPPTYRRIGVSVAVVAKPGYSPDGVRRWSEQVLRQYLSPVPPYGPAGRGWPLGRRVFPPELEAAVLQVEGIEYVSEVLVAEDVGDPHSGPASWREGAVLPRPWEVVELTAVSVVVGERAGPVGELPSGPTPEGGSTVPVPVPRRPSRCCP